MLKKMALILTLLGSTLAHAHDFEGTYVIEAGSCELCDDLNPCRTIECPRNLMEVNLRYLPPSEKLPEQIALTESTSTENWTTFYRTQNKTSGDTTLQSTLAIDGLFVNYSQNRFNLDEKDYFAWELRPNGPKNFRYLEVFQHRDLFHGVRTETWAFNLSR